MRYKLNDDEQAAIDKWLKEGNKVTVCEEGAQTDPEQLTFSWGKKKKKASDAK